MWIRLDREQVERLLRLTSDEEQNNIAQRLSHHLGLEENERLLARYRRAATELYGHEGELEFDEDAVVSGGVAEGAYVMGWRWVDACELRRAKKQQTVKSRC